MTTKLFCPKSLLSRCGTNLWRTDSIVVVTHKSARVVKSCITIRMKSHTTLHQGLDKARYIPFLLTFHTLSMKINDKCHDGVMHYATRPQSPINT